MALENVFGSPPPVVGTDCLNNEIHAHTMNKHGEKQRNGLLDDNSDGEEKEEGEIEDGEIVDSQEDDEDGGGIAGERCFTSNKAPSDTVVQKNAVQSRGHVQVADDGTSSVSNKKTKRKKKKKRKRPLGQLLEEELGSVAEVAGNHSLVPKPKKQRKLYVDHDQVNNDNDPWFPSNSPPSFQRGRSGSDAYPNSSSPPPLPGYESPPFGRSPQMSRRSRSPPGLYDSPYESDEECDGSGAPPGTGGRYDDGPMEGELLGPPRMMGNGPGKNRRKGRRGENGRQGGGRKKKKARAAVAICKFYQDGKCSKGDDCMFKHDGSVPKKPELCKFYLNGFCAKGDGCLYLHNEYPCKFFHTGVKCYSADKCRFSHDPLTDETRILLEKCLDKEEDEMTADVPQKHFRPSLLGSPPCRFSKDLPAHEALKGIPSLFDIEVSMPLSLQQQQQQQQHPSPPPPPPPHQQQHQQQQQEDHQMGSGAPFFYSETMNGSPTMQMKTPLLPLPFDGNRSQRGHGFNGEQNEMFQPAMGMLDVDDRVAGMVECTPPFMPNGESMDTDLRTMLPQNCPSDGDGSMFRCSPWQMTAVDVDMRGRRMDDDEEDWDGKTGQHSDQEKSRSSDSESESGTKKVESSGPIQVPVHLPKKQRELFLRIQQQQREAGSRSQVDSEKDTKRKIDEDAGEEKGGEEEEETMERDWTEEMGDYDDEEDSPPKSKAGEDEDGDDGEEDERRERDTDEKGEKEEAKIIADEKEKWYSSDDDDDDEDQPLAAVLKKLQQQPIQKVEPIQKPAAPFPTTTSIFDIAKMIQSIANQSPRATATNTGKSTKEVAAADPRSQSTKTANLSRDPRSQKQIADSRDPRAPRNIETHEHIHKSFFRDPRMSQSTASIHKDGKSPSLPPAKKEVGSPDSTDGTNPNSIFYRVHTIVTSRPDYSSIASLIHMDPKRIMADPRLKRHLASGARFACSAADALSSTNELDEKKKTNAAKDFVKACRNKPITTARLGRHRLGAVTMPGPLKDEPLSKGSGGSGILDSGDEEFSMYEIDDIIKKPNAFPRRISRDSSMEGIRSPGREVAATKEPTVAKRGPVTKVEKEGASRESGTPPLAQQSSAVKRGSYERKCSMDYASPLGDYDSARDGTEHSDGFGGYKTRLSSVARPPVAAVNKPSANPTESPPSFANDLLELPVDSPSSDDALVIDNASLKDIFKTIDPTASPFC